MDLFPEYSGTERERAEQCLAHVNREIMPTRLNVIQFIRHAARTPEQIMREKQVFLAFPCLDLSLVTAESLIKNGIPSTLVGERRTTGEVDFLHMMLEATLDGKPFHIEVGRKVSLRQGHIPVQGNRVIRLADGKKVQAKATRDWSLPYSRSHARESAYRILGFRSRLGLMRNIKWSLPYAIRVTWRYNQSKLVRRMEKRGLARKKGKK